MKINYPCPSCGSDDIKTEQLLGTDSDNWFIRCYECPGICTLTHAIENEAIKQWNNLWIWSRIDQLEKNLEDLKRKDLQSLNKLTEDQTTLKHRFEVLFNAFVKTRLEYSGGMGNINAEKRREIMVNEIKAELKW